MRKILSGRILKGRDLSEPNVKRRKYPGKLKKILGGGAECERGLGSEIFDRIKGWGCE